MESKKELYSINDCKNIEDVKELNRQRWKRYYAKNRDKKLEYLKKYRERNKGKIKVNSNKCNNQKEGEILSINDCKTVEDVKFLNSQRWANYYKENKSKILKDKKNEYKNIKMQKECY